MYNETYLSHHGVKGQKWGVRRQQERIAKKEKRMWKKRLLGQANADYESRRIKFESTHDRYFRDARARNRYASENIKKRDEYVKNEWIKKYGEEDYNKTVRRENAMAVTAFIAATGLYAYYMYKMATS